MHQSIVNLIYLDFRLKKNNIKKSYHLLILRFRVHKYFFFGKMAEEKSKINYVRQIKNIGYLNKGINIGIIQAMFVQKSILETKIKSLFLEPNYITYFILTFCIQIQ